MAEIRKCANCGKEEETHCNNKHFMCYPCFVKIYFHGDISQNKPINKISRHDILDFD